MALLVAAVAVVLAAAVVAFAPTVVRRRRHLVPADSRFARAVQAVADLATVNGVRTPSVLIMPGTPTWPTGTSRCPGWPDRCGTCWGHVLGFETLVEALDQGDQQLVKQASTLLADGNAEWEQWAAGGGVL